MKKKLLVLFVLILTLFSLSVLLSFNVSAEESTEPTVSIDYFNLVFDDNIYLKYAVKYDGVDSANINSNTIGMLYFTEPQKEYIEGNESSSSSVVGYTTINEVKYYTFEYRELCAKQMTDYIYCVAYIDIGGQRYYSAPIKYSILNYAYSNLGKTGVAASNQDFINMLSSMLVYGANAQRYFNYKTDRLADADYFLVEVVGGTLEDGFTKGLYHAGQAATLTAPETVGEQVFAGWVNSAGETVSVANPLIIDKFAANETYTAIYKKGIAFTSNGDGTCYVSGIGSCTDTNIVIPSVSPAGDRVTSIGYQAFFENTTITRVEMPDSITSIGDGAFYACTNLASVVLSDNLTSIGAAAFGDCTKLTSVVIPDSVTTISMYAFYGCQRLMNVTFGNGVKTIGFGAFYNCGLTSVVLPGGVTSFGESVFGSCDNLVSVVIPADMKTISLAMFDECVNLKNVYYKGTESDWAEITIGDYNTYLTNATRYYYSETEPTIVGNFWHYVDGVVTVWPEFIPNKNSLEFTSNGDGTCYVSGIGNCTDTDIVIPSTSPVGDTVTAIGENAFKGNTNITSVVLPDSVTSIGNSAFRNCSNIKSIELPDGLMSVGNYALQNLSSISSVVIPKNITSIGDLAFYGWTNLTTVYYKGTESDWAKMPIDSYNSLANATRYYYSETAPTTAGNYWRYVDSVITVWPGMLAFTSNGDGTCYISGIGTLKDTDIVIPSISPAGDTVTAIGASAFYGCTAITSVVIPDTVTSISDEAFRNCDGITSIIVPNSVISIGGLAFGNCDNLATVVLGDNVATMGNSVFFNCPKLTSIEIPHGITLIDYNTFAYCSSLTSIIIPNSVTTINMGAFDNCNSLTTVYYNGSASDWSKITIDSSNRTLTGATRYYYSESAPTTSGNFWHYVDGVITVWPGMLAFTSNGDGTCYVSGIGTCKDTDIVIPSTSYAGDTVTAIGANAFKSNTNIISVVIPNTVTSIRASAFYGCTKLASVVISNSVTTIDNYAFRQCDALTSIIIPDSVISMGEFSFGNCDKLETALLGSGISTIGPNAFYGCAPLKTVYYKGSASDWSGVSASSNTEITTGATLYYYSETEPTSLGNFWHYVGGVVTVWPEFVLSSGEGLEFVSNGDGTCYVSGIGTCTQATEVVIPTTSPDGDTVTSIGSQAFKDCTTFTRVVIPNSVTKIGSDAFRNCSKLASIEIANSVTSIGNYAFTSCTALTSVEIPDSVTSIGSYAFQKCTALTSVKLSNKLTTVSSYMFDGCSVLPSIVIPDSVTSIGSYAFQNCKKLLTVEFSSKLTSINSYTFNGCSILTSVVLPDTLTSISTAAFASCNGLTTIVIPSGVKQISNDTFKYCNKLATVTLPAGLTTIGNNAFYYSALTSITLPETLTKIGDSAFEGCDFESITIPAAVTRIGKNAFLSCSNLTSVTFADTKTWYMSTSSSSGGTQKTVTNTANNATALRSYDNKDKYWYKK